MQLIVELPPLTDQDLMDHHRWESIEFFFYRGENEYKQDEFHKSNNKILKKD